MGQGPRRSERKGVPALGSAVIHVVALGLAWWTSGMKPPPVQFVSYHIEMVALPAPEPADVPEPAAAKKLVIETPQPAAAETEPVPPPPPEKAPEKKPAPAPEKKPEEKKPEKKPAPAPEKKPTPTPTETKARSPDTKPDATGGDAINVRMEGLRRDYPAYYDNIIRQINRCMRWQGPGTPETTVYFVIRKDGKMTDLKPLEPSGNIAFDAEALGAVECAGSRFGPLPQDLPFDRLPVRFTIKASRGGARHL